MILSNEYRVSRKQQFIFTSSYKMHSFHPLVEKKILWSTKNHYELCLSDS